MKCCDTCQRFEQIQTIAPILHPIKVTGPWDMVGIDLIGPIPTLFDIYI